MRLLAASLLTLLLLLYAPVAATFEDCSCSAADGSCSASVSCPGGCIAVCPSGGCSAKCTKTGGGPGGLSDEDGELFSLAMPVTMQHVGSSGKQIASDLSRITGQPVVFSPYRADDPISLDVKKAELWDVLDALSMSGKIQIGGDDFSKLQSIRSALVAGEKVTVCIHGATVQHVVAEFASLSGRKIKLTSGDPKAIVNVTVKDITFEGLIALIASQSGVEISLI